MKHRLKRSLLLIVILLIAAALRLTGLDWDGYHHYHPDERYITWIATTIEAPSSLVTALNPTESTINPFYWHPEANSDGIVVLQDESRKFAYGHVPLYLGVMATRWVERIGGSLQPLLPADWLLTRDVLNGGGEIEFRHLTAVSRALTGLIDVATVVVVYLLGKRLYGTAVGLLAAAFLAVNVMHIQLSHFFTSDPYLTFFVVTAVYFMVVAAQRSEKREGMGTGERGGDGIMLSSLTPLLLAAIFTGLAIGSKFAAVMLFVPLGLTVWMIFGDQWLKGIVTAVFITFLTFALTNPFALLDNNCEVITTAVSVGPLNIPELDWRNCYLQNILTQSSMVRGDSDLAFTHQYIGTTPFLYFIEMQLRWGMGPLLGMIAFVGFGWAIWTVSRNQYSVIKKQSLISALRSPNLPISLIPLAWLIPYFIVTGSFLVKFMRYLQPMTPFLMIYGAAMVWQWRHKWVRWGAITAVLLFTSLYALAFVNMYTQPHPWVTASLWVFDNIPPGTTLLSEQWDDALPSTLMVDGAFRSRQEYVEEQLTWHTGTETADSVAKLERNLDRLANNNYVTILSNRVYGVDPRLPERYPLSNQYHQLLFHGKLA